MAKRRRKSSRRKFNLSALNVDVNMQPVLFSAIFFGFAISYSQFSGVESISSALTSFVLAVAVSYLFLVLVYKVFRKFLFYKNAEMIKNHNPVNYFLIIALSVLSGGKFLFLDLMNFDLKFKRSYRPFLKDGWRSGLGYETAYRSALIIFLIFVSVIVSMIHNASENIITYYLMNLLIWSLIWSAIPLAAIFSGFLMLGEGTFWKNARAMVPETGGTKMLFANRRMWIFFGTLSLLWGIGLLMNANLLGVFMFSLLIATLMLLLLLIFWDFREKKNVTG